MPMDAWRHCDSFYICLDLPGINPESIDLTVEQNVLTVRADRAPAQADGAQMTTAATAAIATWRAVSPARTLSGRSTSDGMGTCCPALKMPTKEAFAMPMW